MALGNKPRRLRADERLRAMARETRISEKSLVYPVFVHTGDTDEEIPSMPGQMRLAIKSLPKRAEELLLAGVSSVMLFGLPSEKDECGSGAYAEGGVVQNAVRALKKGAPQLYVICDTCLCEYTSHGHCGAVVDGYVDNGASVGLIAKTALSQAQSGCDMVAPSDMMDGRVGAIRAALDANGFEKTPILSYAAKYASGFYGPFREAAGSAPSFGDRKSYQMDFHNSREALKEIALDVEEGADIVMVKPALSYLDVIWKAKEATSLPVAAYSVSGEYSMIKAASQLGWMDEDSLVAETAASIFRAGADILVTYYAEKIASFIASGRIG
jgi:porphobilinogen synthase